ncbi:ferredoxin [Streptomyces sp. NBC_01361]|uniref:ferredoxin n=1 Tax=Streptomyces sp. NBC_01361 TaxID=2903838 RepID=UPI002E359959|nr:ferredoxin [Streptomyces sp. NBC_01361]
MRLVADPNRCQGFAQCAFLAPDVFALHAREALLFTSRFDEVLREQGEQAAAARPVQTMLVDVSDEPTTTPWWTAVPTLCSRSIRRYRARTCPPTGRPSP